MFCSIQNNERLSRHRYMVLMLGVAFVWVIAWAGPAMSGQSTAHPPVEIQIYTTPPGTAGHALAVGLTDLLRKHSDWLRSTAEKAWGTDILKLWHRDPKRKETGIGNMMSANLWLGKNKEGITDVKPLVVCRNGEFANPWVTRDPNIKTVLDFVGKRVAIGKLGSGLGTNYEQLFRALGIWDKVKVAPMLWNQSKTAFLDGTVDVAYVSAGLGKGTAIPNPAAMEIAVSTKPFHVIGVRKEWVDKVRATGYPLNAVLLPAGVLGKNQPQPLLTEGYTSHWYASVEVPEDVVYELLRVTWDHADELGKYHAVHKLLGKENLAKVSHSESEFHPGAAKFFKEKGVKMGE